MKPWLTIAAQPRVPRRVGVDHRLAQLDLLRAQVLQRGAAGLGGVRLVVLRDGDDVVVAGERPEAACRRARPASGGARVRSSANHRRHPLDPAVEIGEVDLRGHLAAFATPGRGGGRARPRAQPDLERPSTRVSWMPRVERRRREHVARADVEPEPWQGQMTTSSRSPPAASTPGACRCRRTRARRLRRGRGRRRGPRSRPAHRPVGGVPPRRPRPSARAARGAHAATRPMRSTCSTKASTSSRVRKLTMQGRT